MLNRFFHNCCKRLLLNFIYINFIKLFIFKMLGAPGVLKVAGGVQAIFGGKADLYSQEINDIIAHPNMQPANTPQNDVYSVTTK